MRKKAHKIFLIVVPIAIVFLYGCAMPEKKVGDTVFYPMPPQQPRLQFLTSITTEEDIGKEHSAFQEFIVGKPPPMKRLGRPYDIAAVKGKIYISDREFKKILIIDLEKKKFTHLKDRRRGVLSDPAGIWVTEDDVKYVADMKRKQVVVFGRDNRFLRAYGKKDQFEKPLDVAVYKDRVYVCDFNKNMIFVLDKDTGETIKTIGGTGKEEGEMYKPTHVTVDHEGNIYVNDNFNFRIQVFDQEGNFLKSIGYLGDTLGSFARPKGLNVDREGYLYVVDAAFENVQIFDVKTSFLLIFFGGFGSHPGSMYLPNGLYIDYSNVEYFNEYVDMDFDVKYLVYVGNMAGSKKLNIYGFGDWIGPSLREME